MTHSFLFLTEAPSSSSTKSFRTGFSSISSYASSFRGTVLSQRLKPVPEPEEVSFSLYCRNILLGWFWRKNSKVADIDATNEFVQICKQAAIVQERKLQQKRIMKGISRSRTTSYSYDTDSNISMVPEEYLSVLRNRRHPSMPRLPLTAHLSVDVSVCLFQEPEEQVEQEKEKATTSAEVKDELNDEEENKVVG